MEISEIVTSAVQKYGVVQRRRISPADGACTWAAIISPGGQVTQVQPSSSPAAAAAASRISRSISADQRRSDGLIWRGVKRTRSAGHRLRRGALLCGKAVCISIPVTISYRRARKSSRLNQFWVKKKLAYPCMGFLTVDVLMQYFSASKPTAKYYWKGWKSAANKDLYLWCAYPQRGYDDKKYTGVR